MKLDYPHGQVESFIKVGERPFDKNMEKTHNAPFHPNSEQKLTNKAYKVLTQSNMGEVNGERTVPMTQTGFRSTFHIHEPTHKKLFAETTYSTAYGRNSSMESGPRQEALRMENRNARPAGTYNTLKADSVKLVTTMYCENPKQSTVAVI